MSLLQTLKDLALEQRKAAITGAGGELATYVVMLLADASALAKAEQREMTDADAETALRKSLNALTKAIEGDPAKDLAPLPVDEPFTQTLIAQRALVQGLLPAMLDLDELRLAIRDAAQAQELDLNIKSMGRIMATLKSAYPGRVDGAKVKTLLETGDC